MLLLLTSLLAFYLAWNLGANDVANSMGTSVGSKAITLRQAVTIAAVLEFTGAVLFGRQVSTTLATRIVDAQQFASMPLVLLLNMVAVLIACGVWLNLATAFSLPVSSSHAVVGAIAGAGWAAIGVEQVNWRSLGVISLTWIVTPIASAAIAALFYSLIRRFILEHPDPLVQLQEWIPWLSASLLSIFGVIVLPSVSQPIDRFLTTHLGWQLPSHDIPILIAATSAIALSLYSWQQLQRAQEQAEDRRQKAEGKREKAEGKRQKGERKAENGEQRTEDGEQNFNSPSPPPLPETLLAHFQVLSACFVAFAHGSNDVGNAIAPLAVILVIQQNGTVPGQEFSVPLWVLVLGGLGIVAGLAVWGKNVIATVGEGILALQPSGGFSAELATATTVLLASRLGFPVSTSHALVGGVVGIGLVQTWRSLRWKTLQAIVFAWIVTIPFAGGLAALVFLLLVKIWG
jgi:PiT family inorganic phosphate transporter